MDESLATLSGDDGTATGSVCLAQHFHDSYRYVICLDLDKSVFVELLLNPRHCHPREAVLAPVVINGGIVEARTLRTGPGSSKLSIADAIWELMLCSLLNLA